jgi:hypothetical protein
MNTLLALKISQACLICVDGSRRWQRRAM